MARLKELREFHCRLRLIHRVPLINPISRVDPPMAERGELIKIFTSSIETATNGLPQSLT